MKEITVEERKSIVLEILCKIHEFCDKNSIQYFLDFGTLLGAVRHKGFIPWDDDIDICMPRPDYEKFLALFKDENLGIANYRNTKYFPILFSKVYNLNTFGILNENINLNYGVAVDIFPLDGFDSVTTRNFKKYKRNFRLYNIILSNMLFKQKGIKGCIKRFIGELFSIYSVARKTEEYSKKDTYNNSLFVADKIEFLNFQARERRWYEKSILMPFEKYSFRVPEDYNSVLICLYGDDYMTPPPVDQRGTLHSEKYYWK